MAVIAFVLVAICRKVNDEKVNTDDSDKEKKTGKSGGGGASSGEFTTMTREKAQPLDEVQIAIMRKERQKELEMEKVFKQIFLYVLFLALLFVVTYSNSDNNTTMYTNANMYYTYKSMLINILTSGQFYSSSQKVYQQVNRIYSYICIHSFFCRCFSFFIRRFRSTHRATSGVGCRPT